MLSSLRSAWMGGMRTIGGLPPRWLRPLAGGRSRAVAGLYPHQWILLLGFSAMFCVPHAHWNNWFGVILSALALLSYWWDCAAQAKEPWNPALLGGGVWLFLILCILSCLWAWSPLGGVRVTLFYLSGFALAYVFAAAFSSREARNALFTALYAVLLYTALYGLFVHFTRKGDITVPIDGVEISRLGSTLEHGINYSEFLAMLLPIELIWALQRPKRAQRILLSALLLVPLAAILLTYSRTGWVSLAAAVFVLIWVTDRRWIPFVLILGVVSLFFLPHSVQSRLLSMLDFSDTGSSGRFTLWRECAALWREHWLWGVGLGPENFHHGYEPFCTGVLPFDPPHSNMLYMEMGISLGAPGFAAFLCFFFGILFRLGRPIRRGMDPRERQSRGALLAALSGMAVGAIPEYIWFYPRILFCWCMLYGLALGLVSRPSSPS